MLIIAGLGNPGDKYEKTRHNAGFMFMDELYKELQDDYSVEVKPWELSSKFEAWMAEARVGDDKIILMKPNTFMNKSGLAIAKLWKWHRDDAGRSLVVAHDDLDVLLGEYKLQYGIGPKVHNGVNSVVQQVGTPEFWRLRLGVDGRGGDRSEPGDEYVLREMSEDERVELKKSMEEGVNALRVEFATVFVG